MHWAGSQSELDLHKLNILLIDHHRCVIQAFGAEALTPNFHKFLHIGRYIRDHGSFYDISVRHDVVVSISYSNVIELSMHSSYWLANLIVINCLLNWHFLARIVRTLRAAALSYGSVCDLRNWLTGPSSASELAAVPWCISVVTNRCKVRIGKWWMIFW